MIIVLKKDIKLPSAIWETSFYLGNWINNQFDFQYLSCMFIKFSDFRIAKIWFLVNWTFRLTSYGRLQEKTLKFLHSFTRKVFYPHYLWLKLVNKLKINYFNNIFFNKVVDERKTFLEGTNGHFSQLSSSQGPTDDDKSEDSLGC